MQIKPTQHYILVQFHFPEDQAVVLPDNVTAFSPSMEDKRTKVECLAHGEDVTVCHRGDFLLILDPRNMIPISKNPATALIHDSIVVGIVLDDKPTEVV